MTNPDNSRQSMLSVPARWSALYFDIFYILCVAGVIFVVCYGIFSRQPDESVMDVAADILLRLAAVPIVAALLAFIIMRVRDFAMKTWETFRLERYNKGREDGREEGREEGIAEGLVEGRQEGREKGREEGREEGIEIGTQRAIREIRERLARREASQRGERDDWLDEILSELSENGSGERRRPRS